VDVSPPLTIYERADRRHELYLRWAVGRSHARPKLRALDSVRDAHGRRDPERVARALELGLAQYRHALSSAAKKEAVRRAPLTLAQGFARALAFPDGLYPSRTPSWCEARRAEGRILAILGKQTPWESLRAPHLRRLWRAAARRFNETGTGGPGAAETDVKVVCKVAGWLVEAGALTQGVPLPRRWRRKLAEDWAHITADASVLAGPRRPRYSQTEMRAIFANVHLAPPQLALLLTLGGEFRGGQVLRCHRSHLALDGEGTGPARLAVPGRGPRKPGGVVVLDDAQRAATHHALNRGYLAALEAAYQRGDVADYPLFPALRGSGTHVPVRPGLTAMNRSALQELMRMYEAALGISHAPGRLLHGIRRAFADALVAADVDPSVQDAAAGWTPGGQTRERVYRETQRERELQEAARIRARVRQGRTDPAASSDAGAGPGAAGAAAAHPASAPSSAEPSEEGA
jgi:hypothetical protein